MSQLIKILTTAALISGATLASAQANTLDISGTIYKQTGGTTFDTWKFDIQATGTFTIDVSAYEASQSSATASGYYASDINGDGELTWLDPDTYFYKDTGQPLVAIDAIVRCDDVVNNCTDKYQNGLTASTSPLVVTSHLQSETPVDGSVHFRRDPWFDVSVVTPGNYLYLVADYLLNPAEAEGDINVGDSFSPPTGYVNPIIDHADYRFRLSSDTLNFSISGNTITVTSVPLPGAVWLFGSAIVGMVGFGRRKAVAA